LTVQVVSVNNIPAQRAGETGFIQISTLASYNRRIAAEEAARREQAAAAWRERQEIARKKQEDKDSYYVKHRDSVEFLSVNFAWAGKNYGLYGDAGLLLSGIYWSPIPFTAIGFEIGVRGLLNGESGSRIRTSPTLGLFFPIGKKTSIFTDALFEIEYFKFNIGDFDDWHGLITDWMTPGFNVGIRFGTDVHLNLKYRGVFYKESYAHSVGIGAGFGFGLWKD